NGQCRDIIPQVGACRHRPCSDQRSWTFPWKEVVHDAPGPVEPFALNDHSCVAVLRPGLPQLERGARMGWMKRPVFGVLLWSLATLAVTACHEAGTSRQPAAVSSPAVANLPFGVAAVEVAMN